MTFGLDGFTPANWHHGLWGIEILEHHPVAVIVVEKRVATMLKRGFSMINLLVLVFVILLAYVSPVSMQADRIQIPNKTKNFSNRVMANQPLMKYQNGHLYSKNQSHSGIWINHFSVINGTEIEKSITFPDSLQTQVSDVAVSFDDRIAVSASVMDREGRFAAVIAWYRLNGSLIRIVRTSPFGATKLGFTSDGSLWAVGIEKMNPREEEPVHDVMRQYDSEGKLVRTLLPRLSLTTEVWHPALRALLLTSKHFAALVATHSRTWTLVSTEGIIVDSGTLDLPDGFEIVVGGVTDSGRIFVGGMWSQGTPPKSEYPRIPLFEIDRSNNNIELINTTKPLPEGTFGTLLGTEGENLVFHVKSNVKSPQIIWAKPD